MKKELLFLLIVCLSATHLLAIDNVEQIDKNIAISRLTDNAYLIQSSYACNGHLDCNHLLIVDTKDIVLVNTPVNDSLTAIMLNCIEKKFNRKVTKVIVSHFHDYSSGGLKEISKRGINSFGSLKTRKLLYAKGRYIDFVFNESLSIPLQTTHLELFYPGAGHSIDNIVVWLPNEKILFGGCLLKSPEATDKGNIQDADLTAWPVTVQRVKSKFPNAEIVIPGHLGIGDATIFDHTIALVEMK